MVLKATQLVSVTDFNFTVDREISEFVAGTSIGILAISLTYLAFGDVQASQFRCKIKQTNKYPGIDHWGWGEMRPS